MSAFNRRPALSHVVAATALLGILVWSPSQARAEQTAMEEVLGILRAEGVIDEATSERVLAKHVTEQQKAANDTAGLLGGFEWFGDLRLRYEAFRFDSNPLPRTDENDDRYRLRYRARFGFKKKINDNITAGIRLATGGGENDSTNQTFGGSPDFAGDGIFFDQAWLDLKLIDDDGMGMNLVAGRVPNPYVWKAGKDFLVWDNDVNMEGAYLRTSFTPAEKTEIFVTLGSFIARELSEESDPKILGGQLGFTSGSDTVSFGIRGSLYDYRSLNAGFLGASNTEGNLIGNRAIVSNMGTLAFDTTDDGLIEDGGAFDDGNARVGDFTAYLNLSGSENWPMTLYGTYVKNFEADGFTFIGIQNNTMVPVNIDDEDTAWGLGFEVGDKKKNVALGIGYFHVEANAVVSQFQDSDLFDGFTNRQGFVVYASRQVAKNTDFKLTFFSGEEIEDDGDFLDRGTGSDSFTNGPLFRTLDNADRMRLQADIELKF